VVVAKAAQRNRQEAGARDGAKARGVARAEREDARANQEARAEREANQEARAEREANQEARAEATPIQDWCMCVHTRENGRKRGITETTTNEEQRMNTNEMRKQQHTCK